MNYFTLWSWINSVWNYILTLRIILWCETVLFLKWWIWSNQLYFSVRLISCFARGKVVYQIEWIIWCNIIFFSYLVTVFFVLMQLQIEDKLWWKREMENGPEPHSFGTFVRCNFICIIAFCLSRRCYVRLWSWVDSLRHDTLMPIFLCTFYRFPYDLLIPIFELVRPAILTFVLWSGQTYKIMSNREISFSSYQVLIQMLGKLLYKQMIM